MVELEASSQTVFGADYQFEKPSESIPHFSGQDGRINPEHPERQREDIEDIRL